MNTAQKQVMCVKSLELMKEASHMVKSAYMDIEGVGLLNDAAAKLEQAFFNLRMCADDLLKEHRECQEYLSRGTITTERLNAIHQFISEYSPLEIQQLMLDVKGRLKEGVLDSARRRSRVEVVVEPPSASPPAPALPAPSRQLRGSTASKPPGAAVIVARPSKKVSRERALQLFEEVDRECGLR